MKEKNDLQVFMNIIIALKWYYEEIEKKWQKENEKEECIADPMGLVNAFIKDGCPGVAETTNKDYVKKVLKVYAKLNGVYTGGDRARQVGMTMWQGLKKGVIKL